MQEYIIQLGKKLPLVEEYKTDGNIIRLPIKGIGCKTRQNNDTIVFTADSDAILTKGNAILIRTFSAKAIDIATSRYEFIDEMELKEHLSLR
jgi:cysteine desulfuration protein SufE